MASPPCVRPLWVWVMMVVWAPGALEKCIFDEVQSSVSVVTTTPTHQEKLHHKTTNSSISSQLHTHSNRSKDPTQSSFSRSAQLASSPTAQSGQRERRKLRELAPPRDPTRQPIRIKTWVPRESPVLSQTERERLDSAVREAVLMVSSLLSGRSDKFLPLCVVVLTGSNSTGL